MKNSAPYLDLINSFGNKRILVIGDLLLDVYLKGVSTRLCPEAPVPVVDVQERTVLLGGAANAACNLRALGASVVFCSVVGNDRDGEEALGLVEALGIDGQTIIRHPNRKTITKSRVVSGSQVITRMDQGSEDPVDETTTRLLIARIENALTHCDAILISDYDKGVITPALVERLARLCKKQKKFIAIDSKRLTLFSTLQPSYVKPNYEEVTRLLGVPIQHSDRIEQVAKHAEALYKTTNAALITVTFDIDGSMLIDHGHAGQIFSAPAVVRPHVAGAGDTYISGFVLSYINSHDQELSARIATACAAVAIRKECTATCSQAELRTYFNIDTKFIADLNDLKDICDVYRSSGKRIVFTNGCFDILHSGHVTYLHRAKELGDVLIVGLNTDESIKRIKGKNRPINVLADRLQVLAGLSSVDHIIPFGNEQDDTPVPLIRLVKPHVFVKGGDYTKEKLPEAETVELCGGEIVFIDHIPDHSTTRIISRITQASKGAEKAFSGMTS